MAEGGGGGARARGIRRGRGRVLWGGVQWRSGVRGGRRARGSARGGARYGRRASSAGSAGGVGGACGACGAACGASGAACGVCGVGSGERVLWGARGRGRGRGGGLGGLGGGGQGALGRRSRAGCTRPSPIGTEARRVPGGARVASAASSLLPPLTPPWAGAGAGVSPPPSPQAHRLVQALALGALPQLVVEQRQAGVALRPPHLDPLTPAPDSPPSRLRIVARPGPT